MFGFLLKKWFFDFWDNLISIILLNIGFIIALAITFYLPYILSFSPPLALTGLVVGIFILNIYAALVSMMMGNVADFQSIQFKDLKKHFVFSWKVGLALGAVTVLQIIIGTVAFPFYLNKGGVLGLGAFSLLFWLSLVWALASQYFFPIWKRLDQRLGMVFKKSLLLFFDNTLLTIGIGIFSLILIVLSVITAMLIPGAAGLLLLHQVTLRLLILKYDYLEENPEVNRKKVPWAGLLLEERDRVGKRTLKGMIFPWKE